jgi:hypothetical protein
MLSNEIINFKKCEIMELPTFGAQTRAILNLCGQMVNINKFILCQLE